MAVTINGTTGIDLIQDGAVTDTKLNLTANSQEIKDALNATGTAPIYACRAWVNFNGTLPAANMIRASGNVSSITDNGVGNWTANFTTAMADADYSVVASGGNPGSRDGGIYAPVSQALTTTAVRVRGFGSNAPDTPYDLSVVCISIFR